MIHPGISKENLQGAVRWDRKDWPFNFWWKAGEGLRREDPWQDVIRMDAEPYASKTQILP